MMTTKNITLFLALFLVALPVLAARRVTEANLPASCKTGRVYVVTNASSSTECTPGGAGGDSTNSICACNSAGTGYIALESAWLLNIVEDLSPQLGAQLDVNTFGLGDSTLELSLFVETASAVNEVTITNAATGNGPNISASGDDTNVDLNLTAKGTGSVVIGKIASGAIPLHVFKATASEIARLENTLTGTPANWMSLYDTGGRTAHWGMASTNDDDLHFMNDTATGSLVLGVVGAAALTIESDKGAIFAENVKINDILTLGTKGTAPATCAIGDFYVDNSGAACACTASNTWSNMTGTGTCA